jgi:hypothetical protein
MLSLLADQYRGSGYALVMLVTLMLMDGSGNTMRSKCCSPVEKDNVPSVIRP